ncbi:hypothetical protein [Bordetella hinzii]|uniref:N-acetyltransferase YedL n=1 Tax=Bordetella hinzii OH87 BAL007II TaxID=1331262 RepID=A0ABR4R3F1_9BORD|nr:hypothetical protein [Bordetella hinzii]AKQ59403.1 hypothetical protein ACR55_01527 [Bordetella hinzii]KCB24962.1 hypothetical protein L544_0799 [Bordetella hinzii OH87 BAL007II]KCB30254.1 hypothetical protein L541_1158 [Bordetella hinzii CA90 BAL1384]KCB44310.1 hypothetical protein L539_0968 [Bordetella hinzii 5132]KCB48058.1 hypothetical protein L538_0838 [Bordetella hinzii 4161]
MKPRRWPRWLAGLLLAAVLGLGFAGYLSPQMRVNWENVAALCGF